MDGNEWDSPGPAPEGSGRIEPTWVGRASGAADRSAPERSANERRPYRPDPAWDKLLLVVGATMLVVALLVVPGIVSRGGGNPVAEAAQATLDSPGVRMTFTASVSGPTAVTMNGGGLLNGETNRAAIGMNLSGQTPEGNRSFRMDEVVDGDNVYIRAPLLTPALGTTKTWLLLRGEAFGDLPQGGSGGVSGGMLSGPKEQLDALESTSDNVVVVGHEPINGIETTRYRAEIDFQKVLDRMRDQLPSGLADLIEQRMEGAHPTETVDAWVDHQGLIRRDVVNGTLGAQASFTMTIDFSHYGIHPAIDVPPESDSYDMTPLLEHALSGLSGS